MNKTELNRELRQLPSVEKLVADPLLAADTARYSIVLVTRSAQEVLAALRARIGEGAACPPLSEVIARVKEQLARRWPGFLSPVINGTGVILHTNLGRAPLSAQAVAALERVLGGYYSLELDLGSGERGRRVAQLEELLCLVTGAESALVVNNTAAAVLLILTALARGREVVVSRGELVQIGGGFRVPEVMAESDAILREVGTTNQTFVEDYERALGGDTALLLKVHPSNFAIRGFSHTTTLAELKALGIKHHLPVVYDLGSGALLATEAFGLEHEPTIQEALASWVDLVCVSGDKLLGGPQAGIILGSRSYVDRLRGHPLLRAVRIGKLTALALQATLLAYLNRSAEKDIPVWRMMAYQLSELDARATAIATQLEKADIKAAVIDGRSMVGGGSLPDQSLPTRLVSISPAIPVDELAARLRRANPPLLGRIEAGQLLIDPRTVLASQDSLVVAAIRAALA